MNTVRDDDDEHRSRSPPPKPGLSSSDYATGICLLFVVVLLWTSSNFVTQYMFTDGYQKPFMITYLSTASFALYLLPFYLRKLLSRKKANYQSLTQNIPDEHGPLHLHEAEDHFTPEQTAKLAVHFCFIWFVANWTLNASLAYTSVASATVLSGMSGIFTLAVGRMFRVETLTLVKVVAVLTSFCGVVLVSLSDSSSSPVPNLVADGHSINIVAILGDFLALLSALFYALYLIFLKVQIKEESRIDMQLFFGYVGLFNISLCWPVALLLHWLGVESLEFPKTREAVIAILANMFITLASDYIYVIAMLKTTPLVVTVGLSLTIPLAVVGDYFLGRPAAFQVLVGAVLVTGAFIVVGIQNSNSRESDGLLVQDLDVEGTDQLPQRHPDEAILLASQTNTVDA